MFELIPSEYVRNYYKERGITFSDRERAMLICNRRDVPISVRWKELEKIAADTNDIELKTDIKELIEHDHKQVELLKNNDNRDCVYTIYGISGFAHEHFSLNFERALERGVSVYENYNDDNSELFVKEGGFYIYKRTFGDFSPKDDGKSILKGEARFNQNGEMLSISGQGEILRKGEKTTRYVPLENPFKRGDIVMDCITHEIGVVEIDFVEPLRAGISTDFDFCNDYIYVTFIRNSAPIIIDLPRLPIMLEKVENFDVNGKSAELLREMSDILRGKGRFMKLFLCFDNMLYNMNDRTIYAKKDYSEEY